MPTISTFYGIAIRMFFNDHPPAHVHALIGEHEGIVDIATGDVVAGRLPARAQRLVRDWALQYHDELMANWERARRLEPLQQIPGLE